MSCEVSIAEASRQLSQIVNRASYGGEVVLLTSRGKPKAVVVSIETFQQLLQVHEIAQARLESEDTAIRRV